MLKLTVFLCLFAFVVGGKSPNGEKYLAHLSAEERDAMPKELMEDALLDVPGLINKYGYINETYDVVTEDNYIVNVHRIAGKRGSSNNGTKKVVFMMHGLMGCSVDWIIMGPGRSLGYLLADAGYDVWLGNARGNFYSRKHSTLDPDTSRKYWMFSWDQIGRYDLPAMIDFILEKTGQEKLQYFGHSQGTTSFFVMTSERPEYNDKIYSMQAFAPVAFLIHSASDSDKLLAKYMDSLQVLFTLIGRNEFLPKTEFLANFAHKHCSPDSDYIDKCIILLFGGGSIEGADPETIPLILSHNPAGASSRQFVHYTQGYLSGKFRNYDYGFMANMVHYGNIVPPSYPLKKVTAPVALHYSDIDVNAHPLDVMLLKDKIKNPIGAFKVPRATWGHGDFIWAKDAKALLYDGVMELMKEYEN